MNILVTGSSGFIGSKVAQRLQENHTVIPYDICTGSNILDIDQLENTIVSNNIDLVFHIAAQANLYEMKELAQASQGINTNVTGTSNIALVCSKHKIKLIYASTVCVYGDTQKIKKETLATEPQELYAYTKLMGEQIIKGCHKNFDLDYIMLRFATVYGPGMRDEMGCCVFFRQALAGEDLTVHGDGTQVRTITYVDDIVRGCVNAVEFFHTAKNNTYNLSATERISALKMANDIIRITDSSSKIKFIEQRKNQTFTEYVGVYNARCHLNWKAEMSWFDGLQHTLNWYVANKL